jgi:hypothetical protein
MVEPPVVLAVVMSMIGPGAYRPRCGVRRCVM